VDAAGATLHRGVLEEAASAAPVVGVDFASDGVLLVPPAP
jgi:hypothetical protein